MSRNNCCKSCASFKHRLICARCDSRVDSSLPRFASCGQCPPRLKMDSHSSGHAPLSTIEMTPPKTPATSWPLVPNSASTKTPVDPVCLSPHQQPLSVPVLAAEPDWRCRLSAELRLQRTCCLHFAAATNKLSTMALRVFSASAILAPIGSVTNSSQSESSKKHNRGSEAVFSRSANVFMSNSSRANHRFRHLTLRLRMMRYVKCQMSGKQRHVLALAICLQY